MLLREALDIAEKTFDDLRAVVVAGSIDPNVIQRKVDYIRYKNSGYLTLVDWQHNGVISNELQYYTDNELLALQYAPISSAAVERLFSHYKIVLRKNRHRLTFKNLVKLVMTKYNIPMILVSILG